MTERATKYPMKLTLLIKKMLTNILHEMIIIFSVIIDETVLINIVL